MDIAFGGDGIKQYGLMMKEFMLDESAVYKLYRKTIDDIAYRDVVNIDKYSIIRMKVPELNADESIETNLEYLYRAYEITTEEQKRRLLAEYEAKGIDLEELIRGNADRIIHSSQQLAESLLEYWLEQIAQKDRLMLREVFTDVALQDVLEMFRKLFRKLQLSKVIAKKIKHYVDDYSKNESAYEMIADISAEILNRCINNIGMDYFTQSDFDDLKHANETNNLGLALTRDESRTEESVVDLFAKIDRMKQLSRNDPETVKSLPTYRNYILWRDRLKIGFIAVCDIPNYDVGANERLGTIINECKTVEY